MANFGLLLLTTLQLLMQSQSNEGEMHKKTFFSKNYPIPSSSHSKKEPSTIIPLDLHLQISNLATAASFLPKKSNLDLFLFGGWKIQKHSPKWWGFSWWFSSYGIESVKQNHQLNKSKDIKKQRKLFADTDALPITTAAETSREALWVHRLRSAIFPTLHDNEDILV